jgi:O-acetyl-ADP-ribose deacetylase (regulator of RNase III)
MNKLIQYHIDEDLFTAPTQVIVNPVNVKGVMGKSLAAEFKKRYPEMAQQYQSECQSGRLRIGRPTLFTKGTPWILNFPTKDQPKAPSKLEYIEQSLSYLVENYQKGKIMSLAFPKVGCGKGELSWDDVGPVLVRYLSGMNIPTHVYINKGDAQYQLASISVCQIGETPPVGEETLAIIEGTTARIMTVCDQRFDLPIYYVCLSGKVQAVTVHEKWARLLYKNYQNEYSE